MRVLTLTLQVKTKGQGDLVDLTPHLNSGLQKAGFKEGSMTVFVGGSTAAITTFEYEPGLIEDMKEAYERLAPSGKRYHHQEVQGDENGASHVRAALQGPSLVIPFANGRLLLGTWQQVVLAEFDLRPRTRPLIVQLMGE